MAVIIIRVRRVVIVLPIIIVITTIILILTDNNSSLGISGSVFGDAAGVHKPRQGPTSFALLGGSWVVITGVISPLIWVISIVTRLITLLNYNYP